MAKEQKEMFGQLDCTVVTSALYKRRVLESLAADVPITDSDGGRSFGPFATSFHVEKQTFTARAKVFAFPGYGFDASVNSNGELENTVLSTVL